jgi:adenylate kinase
LTNISASQATGLTAQATTSTASHQTAQAGNDFLPGPVLLLGAPGVGKGTQAQMLVTKFGIPQISTGDLLRGNIARGTELGLKAKEIMSSGHLVDDEIVNQMVLHRLQEPDTHQGYILDGYPRTLDQAKFLDRTIAGPIFLPRLPVVAISIVVSYDHLLERITGRRTCPTCKHIYNIYSNPPKVADVCDFDGAALTQRSDDTEPVFVERMKTFDAQTAPVVAHYRDQGRFAEVDGNLSLEAVNVAIEQALVDLRRASR